MQVKLLGVMPVDFKSNNGEQISGTNIFVAFKDEAVEGLRTEKIFLKENISLPDNIKLNDNLDIAFNYKGKVEMITKA